MNAEWNLLDKTELRIEPIGLAGANLDEVAVVVADVLALPRADVTVIDARDNLLALDVLRGTVDPYQVAGKERELLTALSSVAGISVDDRTAVCSQGVLGWIADDRTLATGALDRARDMVTEIEQAISRRALVLSTGPEVISGQIEDTNKPWIAGRLREAGFVVTEGGDLTDDHALIASTFREAGQELGYGLVITTGGIGAETKDTTVEALLSVDPTASTPHLFTVERGHGRHAKDAVRIGVGRVGTATVVCLPGPHTEATLGAMELISGLSAGLDIPVLAERIAEVLRTRLRTRRPS